jgi:thiol-disulfide isomerase/thioredoxin
MKRQLVASLFIVMLLASAPASDGQSELRPFGQGSWASLLRSHAGRPTLVHFWGVTCGPCKEELPFLGEFMRDHPDADMVTISADLVPDLPGATKAMLQKSGLSAAENWIFSEGFVERLRFEIDPTWQGDIPRTVLIARDGTITTIEGSDMAEIGKWRQAQLGDVKVPP